MSMMTVEASEGGGRFSALVAEPRTKPAGAVVVIQEIFGVNEAMRKTCEWIADLGFIAVCPDLFWRLEPGVDLTDRTEAEWQKAFNLMQRFDQQQGVADLKATLAAARKLPGCNGRAGSIGYCLGGRLAFMLAEQSDAEVNVSYYGVGLDNLLGDIGRVRAPLIVHIADEDEFFPKEGRQKVIEAAKGHANIRVYTYAGANHAFARVDGVHWNGLAAAIANGRTAEALAAALG